MIRPLRLASLVATCGFLLFVISITPSFESALAQETETAGTEIPKPENSADQQAETELVQDPFESKLVQVDWLEEMLEGGVTMVALAILSVAMLAFLIERFLTLRSRNFVPATLMKKVRPLFHERRYDDILKLCKKHPSVTADIIEHLVNFRSTNFDLLQNGAADLGARAVVDQEEKCNPLSVIAGVAPLLGLLGTMIGMIEAFKLVEVFGDEGGASLLAGSISKALITTAVGLILAIPALLGYHWSRRRVHGISNSIEKETESLLKFWFLNGPSDKR